MSSERKILGIDLGGALQATTGYAVLGRREQVELIAAGVLPASKSADAAERRLLERHGYRTPAEAREALLAASVA